MTLFDAQAGKRLRVVQVIGGRGVRSRLFAMGMNPGDFVRILQVAPFKGTFYIENMSNGSKFAIGRGIARKIIVEYA